MSAVSAQGINFFEGTWQELLAHAAKEDKLIFVDCYAVWCGPCKMMDKNVFTADTVGGYYNTHFINYKMDMEKGEGVTVKQQYEIRKYPSFLFLNAKGEVVHRAIGYKQPEPFIELGEEAIAKKNGF